MKELTRFQLATIKRSNKSTKALRNKRDKLVEKIKELGEELQELINLIDSFEKPIIDMTGGFDSEQVLSGEMDKILAEQAGPSNPFEAPTDEVVPMDFSSMPDEESLEDTAY